MKHALYLDPTDAYLLLRNAYLIMKLSNLQCVRMKKKPIIFLKNNEIVFKYCYAFSIIFAVSLSAYSASIEGVNTYTVIEH